MAERIEINLLPAEYRVHSRRVLFLDSAILLPIIFLVVLVVVLGVAYFGLVTQVAYHKGQIAKIEKEIGKNKHILDEINTLKAQKTLVQNKITALQRISVDREKWIRLQEVLCEKLPESTWLNRVEESADTTAPRLTLEGRTYSFPEVGAYMSRLSESEYFNSVELKNIDQSSAEDGIFRFTLDAALNPDVGLKKIQGAITE